MMSLDIVINSSQRSSLRADKSASPFTLPLPPSYAVCREIGRKLGLVYCRLVNQTNVTHTHTPRDTFNIYTARKECVTTGDKHCEMKCAS